MNDTDTKTIEIEAIVLTQPEGLAPQTLSLISEGFSGFYQEADQWRIKAAAIKVTSPEDKEAIKSAREARLALRSIRVNAEKTRKSMKEDSLRLGKAIDGAYNILDHAVRPVEAYLQEQEDIAERLEAERLQNLRETRLARLTEADPDHIPTVDLASYFDADFEKMLADVRDLRQLRIEREARAEQERIERERQEAEDRERMRIENERLQKEAAEREAQLKTEREAYEQAAAKARAAADAEIARARAEAEVKAKAARAAAAAKLQEEADARAKAEAEAKALRDEQQRQAEARAAQEREAAAAAKKAAAAPDKAKIITYAAAVRGLIPPGVTTEEGRRVAAEITAKTESFARWIEAQAKTL